MKKQLFIRFYTEKDRPMHNDSRELEESIRANCCDAADVMSEVTGWLYEHPEGKVDFVCL